MADVGPGDGRRGEPGLFRPATCKLRGDARALSFQPSLLRGAAVRVGRQTCAIHASHRPAVCFRASRLLQRTALHCLPCINAAIRPVMSARFGLGLAAPLLRSLLIGPGRCRLSRLRVVLERRHQARLQRSAGIGTTKADNRRALEPLGLEELGNHRHQNFALRRLHRVDMLTLQALEIERGIRNQGDRRTVRAALVLLVQMRQSQAQARGIRNYDQRKRLRVCLEILDPGHRLDGGVRLVLNDLDLDLPPGDPTTTIDPVLDQRRELGDSGEVATAETLTGIGTDKDANPHCRHHRRLGFILRAHTRRAQHR
jgi:hypothetical protein